MKFWLTLLELIVGLLFVGALWGGFLGVMIGLGFFILWLRLLAISDKLPEPLSTVMFSSQRRRSPDPAFCDHIFYPMSTQGGDPDGQVCSLCGKFNSLEDVLAQAEETRARGR